MNEQFAAMAAAFKRQFRLELTIESTDGNTIRVVDDKDAGNVKYLGTLRSNWLRRQAPKYGFYSVGHDLLPEVAGGAYTYAPVDDSAPSPIDHVQALEDEQGVHVVTAAQIHSVGVDVTDPIAHAVAAVSEDLPAEDGFVVVHDDPPAEDETSHPSFRERFNH